jgi:hypothetical protein
MKVFYRLRQIFTARLALDIIDNVTSEYTGCLQILDAVHKTATNFIINYDTGGWEAVRPDLKVDQEAVHYVLRELSATACQMAMKKEDVAVVAHAAGWGFALIANAGDLKGQEYSEGMYEFVRWKSL